MRFIKINYCIIFFLFFLASCIPAEKQETIIVNTEGIEKIPTVKILNDGLLGEFLIDSEVVHTSITLTNNSDYELFDIKILFERSYDSNAGMNFSQNEFRESIYPGEGGTCGNSLLPQKSCQIFIEFNPDRRGDFYQFIDLKYKNMIEEMTFKLNYFARVGEYASLGFEEGSSIFNFGSFGRDGIKSGEKTIELVNNGGLTARNISFVLTNQITRVDKRGVETVDEIINGFFIKENNCPKNLSLRERCQLIIDYSNSNILLDDPDLNYIGTLSIRYEKDTEKSSGVLNANLGFSSTAKEANFIFSGIETAKSYSIEVTGTKSDPPETLIIQNDGYANGLIKKFIFFDDGNKEIAQCDSINSLNGELNCFKTGGIPITLAELPFKIYNYENCLNRPIRMKEVGRAGEKCYFNLVYWPSIEFENLNNQQSKKISLAVEFDSQLQGEETIKRRRISQISFSFKKPALLVVKELKIENEYVEKSLEYESQDNFIDGKFGKFNSQTDAFYDLGRFTLVNRKNLGKVVTITIENIGETVATITKISDSQFGHGARGFNIPLANAIDPPLPIDIPSDTNPGYDTFFKKVETTCSEKILNEDCEIRFFLNPYLDSSDPISGDSLFFDHIGDTSFNAKDINFKQFNIFYQNGSLYNDDGSPYEEKRTSIRLGSQIVNKAILEFTNLPSWGDIKGQAFASVETPFLFGNGGFFNVYISNVGTNDISYMYFTASNNLNRRLDTSCATFTIQDIPEGEESLLGVTEEDNLDGTGEIIPTHDCYDIIDYKKEGFLTTSGASINQISELQGSKRASLKKGETCVMRILVKSDYTGKGCLKEIIYQEIADENSVFGYGIIDQQEGEEFSKIPFSSSIPPSSTGVDELPFLASPLSLKKTAYIDVIYFDGDTTAPLLSENKALTDRFIYGEEKSLLSQNNLSFDYISRGNIYIKNVTPMLSTLLMRESNDFLAYDGSLSPINSIPDSYIRSPIFVNTFYEYNSLNEIFQSNIDYHRSLFPFISDDEWRIFLGGYPKNEAQNRFFDFELSSFGGDSLGKVIECFIETDNPSSYDLSNDSSFPASGLIPTSTFANRLKEFGCSFSKVLINQGLSGVSNLTTSLHELKFIPNASAIADIDHYFRINFTIQDGLNPEKLVTMPTRTISFEFSARTISADDQGICLGPEGSCSSSSPAPFNVDQDDNVEEVITLRAAQGEEVEYVFEIENFNDWIIYPKLHLKSDAGSSYVTDYPLNLKITNDCLADSIGINIPKNNYCSFTVTFSPKQGDISESFYLEVAYESVSDNVVSQHRFINIPIETVVLENGEIIPYKVVTTEGNDECTEDELSNKRVSYQNTEPSAVILSYGNLDFEHAKDGVFKTFCIRNPKTLPVFIYDSFENWLPETIDGRENFVQVSTSDQGDVKVYVEEKCLLQSMELVNSIPVLKSNPENATEYGIKDNDYCLVTAFFKPSPEMINTSVGLSTFSIFKYFANVRQGSELPELMRGVKPNADIIAPEATPVFYDAENDRSVYQLESSNNDADIYWKKFDYNSTIGNIDKYLVFVSRNLSDLDDKQYIINQSKVATSPKCIIQANPLVDEYSCNISGLSSGSRYYVRVVPLISYLNYNFVAFDRQKTNTQVFFTTLSDDSVSYDYLKNIFIDKNLAYSDFGSSSYANASTVCGESEKNISVSIGSKKQNFSKLQITLDQWQVILSDIDKFNNDEVFVRFPIWLSGEVGQDFEGVDLSLTQETSYIFELGNYYTYYFSWDGNNPPDQFIISTDELPLDISSPPKYGSLQLKESDGGMELNTRCYTDLPE